MTPKEKAEELVDKLDSAMEFYTPKRFAKQCALIAVDEILNAGKDVDEFADAYWQKVRKEIEKL
jgi:hypothetical protein